MKGEVDIWYKVTIFDGHITPSNELHSQFFLKKKKNMLVFL